MTRLRALSITALLLAAHGLLVPSCVRWNIGQNIRESTERHVGINPGEAYLVGDGEGRPTIARELSYELDTPLISILDEKPTAQDIRMGEHFREATIVMRKIYGLKATVGERVELKGQVLERHREGCSAHLTPRSMGSVEVQYSDSHQLAVIAAAPFDCMIDPVLTVVSSAAVTPLALPLGIAVFGACLWDSF